MEKNFIKGQIVRLEAYGEGKVCGVDNGHVSVIFRNKKESVWFCPIEDAKKCLTIVGESGKITIEKLEADGFELNYRWNYSKHIGKIIVEAPEEGKFFFYSEESTNTHVLYINTFEQLEEVVNLLNKNEF